MQPHYGVSFDSWKHQSEMTVSHSTACNYNFQQSLYEEQLNWNVSFASSVSISCTDDLMYIDVNNP